MALIKSPNNPPIRHPGHTRLLKSIALLIPFLMFFGKAGAITVSVNDSVIGKSPQYIGANEGGTFNINDLVDCGINCYRLWTSMAELEWLDDNGVYGSPSIAQIKANPDIINWAYWDSVFSHPRWSCPASPLSFETIIHNCRTNNIEPVLVLRNRDQNGWPPWTPNPPATASDWNEWWEYCFAVAYWCNVRHDYRITHFQVLNEPDLRSQGWQGDTTAYGSMIQYTSDACRFANGIAGLPVSLHAPVVANYNSPYVSYSLRHADSLIDILDYHTYADNITPSLQAMNQIVKNLDFDNTIEPIWVSEWGTYSSTYNSLSRALLTAQQLLDFTNGGASGLALFLFDDWGTMKGLVGNTGTRTETYYAYRLMCRGLRGAKEVLAAQPANLPNFIMTRDTASYYFIAVNLNDTLHLDLRGLGLDSGSVFFYQYSTSVKDSLTDSLSFSSAQFSIFAPNNAVVEGRIPRVHDVGITEIAKPREGDTLKSGNGIIPECRAKNFGTETESFSFLCTIETDTGTLYEDDDAISLVPGEEYDASFKEWLPETKDTTMITVNFSTVLAGDENRENDEAAVRAIVLPRDETAAEKKEGEAPFTLHAVNPNPHTESVQIVYSLRRAARLTLSLFDSQGRLVKTLIDETLRAGYYVTIWDGKDTYGRHSAGGVYFVKMDTGQFTAIQKTLLLP